MPSTTTQVSVSLAYAPAAGTAVVGDYLDFTGVQLEIASSATQYELRPYAVEFGLCQRYCEIIRSFVCQCGLGGTLRYASAIYRQDKRIMPTVTLSNTNSTGPVYDPIYSSVQQAAIYNNSGNYFQCDITSIAEM